jgi:hypothetical protein
LVDAPDQDLVYGISTLAKYVEKCWKRLNLVKLQTEN